MKRHPLKNVRSFRTTLLKWFSANAKSYPWRETQDPWAILVSEIMLQQTTVASVITNRRYEKFLTEFPDLKSIAHASEEQILRAWEGLGYYNRVRNLQKTAQTLLELHQGSFPKDPKTLLTLPGIGKYTAGAISSFAFDQAAAIVDGNIARVLARLFDYHEAIDTSAGQKQIWQWAEELLDQKNPRLFNSAIMELGQTHCGPRSPSCSSCPVSEFCQTKTPSELPLKKPRKKILKVEEHTLFVLKNDQLLLQEGTNSRRRGFWHLPTRHAESLSHLEPHSTSTYTITHHKVTVLLYHLHETQIPDGLSKNESYHSLANLTSLPLPSPTRKLITQTLSHPLKP